MNFVKGSRVVQPPFFFPYPVAVREYNYPWMTWFSSRRLRGKSLISVDRLCLCNLFIVSLHVLCLKVPWKSPFTFATLRSASFSRFPVLSLDDQVSDKELASCEEVCRSDGLMQHIGWSLLLSSRSLVAYCLIVCCCVCTVKLVSQTSVVWDDF